MAEAPGHRLGQIIGHALEIALEPLLRAFAEEHELYLDKQGTRPARPGRKVTWVDENGNSHDLDFVLERGGSADKIGIPVAFIESAWRRYTKHSRNKAQEIQGAVEPLIRKWASVRPLGGAIVGGQWTRGALDQLRSLGFAIAYIPYEEVVRAFMVVGMTVATTESTTDGDLADEVRKFEALAPSDLARLGEALRQCAPEQFGAFMNQLRLAIVRKVERVVVLALHGSPQECGTVREAIDSIRSYTITQVALPFTKWEISIGFVNGDRIEAAFRSADDAINCLGTFA